MTVLEVVSTGVAMAVTQPVWPVNTPRNLSVSLLMMRSRCQTGCADLSLAWLRCLG